MNQIKCRVLRVLGSYLVGTMGLVGCGEPLVDPALVTEDRVLGARVQAESNADSAWILPGQPARVRWLLASPRGNASVGTALSLCVAETVSRGLPQCKGNPFATFAGETVSSEEPSIPFLMPELAALGDATRVAITAAFCRSGVPATEAGLVDVATTRCPDADESPLIATVYAYVASDGEANTHPSLAEMAVRVDGTVVPAIDADLVDSTGCADGDNGVLRVAAGSESRTLELVVPGGQSETVAQVTDYSASTETLELGHYVTAGDLERTYSEVTSGSSATTLELEWTPPESAEAEGTLAWLYFVLRDGRGGIDWVKRPICVVPSAQG